MLMDKLMKYGLDKQTAKIDWKLVEQTGPEGGDQRHNI